MANVKKLETFFLVSIHALDLLTKLRTAQLDGKLCRDLTAVLGDIKRSV